MQPHLWRCLQRDQVIGLGQILCHLLCVPEQSSKTSTYKQRLLDSETKRSNPQVLEARPVSAVQNASASIDCQPLATLTRDKTNLEHGHSVTGQGATGDLESLCHKPSQSHTTYVSLHISRSARWHCASGKRLSFRRRGWPQYKQI